SEQDDRVPEVPEARAVRGRRDAHGHMEGEGGRALDAGPAVPLHARVPELLLPLRDGLRHPAPQRRGARQAGLPRQAHELRALARVAAAAAPAPVTFTAEDAGLLESAARANPRGLANQATSDLVGKLGAAGNLEALDYLLQLRHMDMVSVWARTFREKSHGKS